MRETSRKEQGRFKTVSLQIGHPCSRLKKRAKRVGDSEQVGIFPNQGAAHQHSKTGRGQTKRRNQEIDRNDVSAADRLGNTTPCSPWNMETYSTARRKSIAAAIAEIDI